MGSYAGISSRLLEFVLRSPGCEIEDILFACPDLTWNQIFFELDRLSREGGVLLERSGSGRYSVAPTTEVTTRTHTH